MAGPSKVYSTSKRPATSTRATTRAVPPRDMFPRRKRVGESGQNILLENLFTRPPIFEIIFSYLSPATLIRFSRACRLAQDAVSMFYARAFNINRHLKRFFSNPIGFRSLQARTGTLISGSNALQFLDRTFYPESDLDLYAHPGHAREVGEWLIQNEGYIFAPRPPQQNRPFHELDWTDTWSPWAIDLPRTDIHMDDMHVERYRVQGLDQVYHFEKPQPGAPDAPPLRLQIILADHTPMACILGFHSSYVSRISSCIRNRPR